MSGRKRAFSYRKDIKTQLNSTSIDYSCFDYNVMRIILFHAYIKANFMDIPDNIVGQIIKRFKPYIVKFVENPDDVTNANILRNFIAVYLYGELYSKQMLETPFECVELINKSEEQFY